MEVTPAVRQFIRASARPRVGASVKGVARLALMKDGAMSSFRFSAR
jgi:hypothetical protein